MITDLRAVFLQKFNDGERRRLAQIIDVPLIGHTQHKHFCPIHGFLASVQCTAHGGQHVIRHIGVDFTGEFDKTRAEVPLLRLP